MQTPQLPGKFIWFEHLGSDVEAARAFYAALFGWTSEPVPMGGQPYPMISNRGKPLGGFRTAETGQPCAWLCYCSTADVDASTAQATAAGAQLLLPPTDFPEVGRGSVIADPTGAVLALWTARDGDLPDADPEPGDVCWIELITQDLPRALDFYTGLFGYTVSEMEGTENPYFTLLQGELPRAAAMAAPEPEMPSYWSFYVLVEDVESMLARAKELGAQCYMEPTEVPGHGRFAVIADPQGAVLSLWQGAN